MILIINENLRSIRVHDMGPVLGVLYFKVLNQNEFNHEYPIVLLKEKGLLPNIYTYSPLAHDC